MHSLPFNACGQYHIIIRFFKLLDSVLHFTEEFHLIRHIRLIEFIVTLIQQREAYCLIPVGYCRPITVTKDTVI